MLLHHLNRFRDLGLLILRVGIGLFFMFAHGWGKITGGPERWEAIGDNAEYVGITFLPVFWGFMASVAEFVGGLLLALGALFRVALFFLLCTMIVAASYHIGSGNGSPYHALEMGVVFLSLFLIGPGKYSVDTYYSRSRASRLYGV